MKQSHQSWSLPLCAKYHFVVPPRRMTNCSYHQHRAGLMDPEDIFLFAESLIGTDNQKYAFKLIDELESEFGSDHKVILGLRKQIA